MTAQGLGMRSTVGPMHARLRLTLAVLCSAAASAAGAQTAQAAIGVTDVTSAASPTQAAAATNFSLGFRLSDPGQQIKDLTIHLPPGLVGNPLAQPACPVAQFSADACPAATAVGTSQVNADPGNLTIDGTIYNLVPQPGEPARLGIVYRNPSISSLFVQSAVKLRPEDGGLDSIIKDLPKQALVGGLLPAETTVKGISLTLRDSFASNPTSCAPAASKIDVTSYAAPAVVASGSASYTPTGCDKVPFAPKLTMSIGNPERASSPSLSTVITQAPGEAGIRDAVVNLPVGIVANATSTPVICTADQAAADACPSGSVVGTAAVRSPLLSDELTGSVYLVGGPAGTLPTLRIDLRGTLRILLVAKVGFSSTGTLQTTLSGIPDVPVSRFALVFRGGKTGGALQNTQALCDRARAFSASFVSQAGGTAKSAGNATLTGCAKKPVVTKAPKATAKLASGGMLVVTVQAGTRSIRALKLSLPVRPAAGRRTAAPGRLRLIGRVASVGGLPKAGTRRVVVRIGGARKLRGKRTAITVLDAGGRRTILRVTVR
ncbi:MAG: hypothetical protein JWP18_451 [Solirubrobacterales bacterium]|nr:hypothetical protein [Solirubrobacterales bacterium]